MAISEWIEATTFAEWVRTSPFGWPLMLYMHSIGMGIMLGLGFLLGMRLLGLFRRVPVCAFLPMFRLLWIAFIVNIVGGVAIFSSRATFFVASIPFLLKMVSVITAAILTADMQRKLVVAAPRIDSTGVITGPLKALSWLTISLWLFAIVSGRLTAYL
ncbi:MAG: hypothetical protein AB7T07_11700 [Steroidobacteraceae bacterium]